MEKSILGLSSTTRQLLKKMGIQIKTARLRRNIKAEKMAKEAGISKGTLTAIEKGAETVSIGAYAAVLQCLGMEMDLCLIAVDEEGQKQYPKPLLSRRKRATK